MLVYQRVLETTSDFHQLALGWHGNCNTFRCFTLQTKCGIGQQLAQNSWVERSKPNPLDWISGPNFFQHGDWPSILRSSFGVFCYPQTGVTTCPQPLQKNSHWLVGHPTTTGTQQSPRNTHQTKRVNALRQPAIVMSCILTYGGY